ncbi:hypothetical protein DKX38_018992 [Salix brachista]|uniref:1-acylglycerol-3-phosphate O-acyltransferase n=1 Tax=Salix brachista TaxID=2182728 RepID=A0A5N5KPJ3_9ROSI|nr:hypothetical protein DKX38_018992 [Salix brachista]
MEAYHLYLVACWHYSSSCKHAEPGLHRHSSRATIWVCDNGQPKTAFVTFKDPKALEIALLLSMSYVMHFNFCNLNEQKCQRSQKFASEVGLPVLKNVVLLKTRGFCLCLEVISFLTYCIYAPAAYFLDNVFGTDPSEVHIHVRRIPAKVMPASDSEAATWLMDRVQLKDRLLSDFKPHSHFPNEGIEHELSTLRCLGPFSIQRKNGSENHKLSRYRPVLD